MSLRNKLLSLLDKIEELEESGLEEALEDAPEEELEDEDLIAEDVSPPEFIEVSPEDCEILMESQRRVLEARADLADLVYRFEGLKQEYIEAITKNEDDLRQAVEDLRDAAGLPEDIEYVFTVPDKPGSPGSFSLKK